MGPVWVRLRHGVTKHHHHQLHLLVAMLCRNLPGSLTVMLSLPLLALSLSPILSCSLVLVLSRLSLFPTGISHTLSCPYHMSADARMWAFQALRCRAGLQTCMPATSTSSTVRRAFASRPAWAEVCCCPSSLYLLSLIILSYCCCSCYCSPCPLSSSHTLDVCRWICSEHPRVRLAAGRQHKGHPTERVLWRMLPCAVVLLLLLALLSLFLPSPRCLFHNCGGHHDRVVGPSCWLQPSCYANSRQHLLVKPSRRRQQPDWRFGTQT